MKKLVQIVVVELLPLLMAATVSATIMSGDVTGGNSGGTFVKLSLPLLNPYGDQDSVGNNNFQNPNMFGFDENQNIWLTTNLLVDVGNTILSGQWVASHYIFFDPSFKSSISGTVNFDAKILGIMTSVSTLVDSDFLANTGVKYENPTARGLEAADGDYVKITNENQIEFRASANSPGDYVRVLTAFSPHVVPEPATMLLLGLGLLGLAGVRRKFKK